MLRLEAKNARGGSPGRCFIVGRPTRAKRKTHSPSNLTLNSPNKIMLLAPAARPLAAGRPRAATRALLSRPRVPVPPRCAPARRAVVVTRAEAIGSSTLPASLPAVDGECALVFVSV